MQLIARGDHPLSEVRDYIRASLSPASLKAYRSDIRHFLAWGGVIPSTPHQISLYISQHANQLTVATLRRRLATLSKAHASQNHPNPVDTEIVRMTLRGIRRTHGRAQRQVQPVECANLLRIVGEPRNTIEIRDRALLLLGFAGAFRRSELVSLDVEDLDFVKEGLLVTLRHSKTDQERVGRKVPIPYARGGICPVGSLKTWLDHAGITGGAVFRAVTRSGRVLPGRLSPQTVALIVKRRAGKIGLKPESYSGHSLRAGFATSAAKLGASIHKIAIQTGHRSHAMIMRYVRDADLFDHHPLREML